MAPPLTLAALNQASAADFAAALGQVVEHSPWVVAEAAAQRPFASVLALRDALIGVIRAAPAAQQLTLLRAHPELAGAEAIEGTLTEHSSSEQHRLGLTSLPRAQFERLSRLNRAYAATFGFPCIIALRLHDSVESVLASFTARLGRGRDAEIAEAITQIGEVVLGRLRGLVQDDAPHMSQAG